MQKQFSVKVGSIFEDSPIGLDKWLPAMWMLVNCKTDGARFRETMASVFGKRIRFAALTSKHTPETC